MSEASYQSTQSWRQRYGALLLALAIELLVALALLSLGAFQPKKPKVDPKLEVFNVLPQASAKKSAAHETIKKTETHVSVAQPTAPTPPIRPSKPQPITLGPEVIRLDRDQYAAADIGKMPAQPDSGDDAAPARARARRRTARARGRAASRSTMSHGIASRPMPS